MADVAHVQLLHSNALSWNQWRKDNPAVQPDLDGADLENVELRGYDLRSAKLSQADLSGANLVDAKLVSADLWQTMLERADLTNADLQFANAKAASFRAATLVRTNLCWANLERADLRAASLHEAEFGRTVLLDADLTGANHLETCRFWAPVGIDFRTLIRSAQIPAAFLRGCGIPEPVIEYLPALFPKPIENYSVLIRSTTEDSSLAERLDTDLTARGIRCWYVRGSSLLGSSHDGSERLEDSLRPFETRLLLVLSRDTTRIRTPWVERDAKLWMQNERVHNRKLLFTIKADEVRMGLNDQSVDQELNKRAVDFRRWRERKHYFQALDKLAAALSM